MTNPKPRRARGMSIVPGATILGAQQAVRHAARSKKPYNAVKKERGCIWLEQEDFYCGVLLEGHSAREYVIASAQENIRQSLWNELCKSCHLVPPTFDLRGKSTSLIDHYNDVAALVLEEARHSISEKLAQRWLLNSSVDNKNNNNNTNKDVSQQKHHSNQRNNQKNANPRIRHSPVHSKATMLFHLDMAESLQQQQHNSRLPQSSRGNTNKAYVKFSMTLDPHHRLSPYQLDKLRHGTLVECLPQTSSSSDATNNNNNSSSSINQIVLACLFCGQSPTVAQSMKITIVVSPKQESAILRHNTWRITPIVGLISEFRQLETCHWLLRSKVKVPFALSLMGQAPNNNDKDAGQRRDRSNSWVSNFIHSNNHPRQWHLAQLNQEQTKAATQFLQSPAGTLLLVQGPPGTGKTTFLAAMIVEYLKHRFEKNQKRKGDTAAMMTENNEKVNESLKGGLMVTAPTNKAVSVVASRVVRALFQSTTSSDPQRQSNNNKIEGNKSDTIGGQLKLVLVGDVDKLIDPSMEPATRVQLESIFVYQFLPNLQKAMQTLRHKLQHRNMNQAEADPVAILNNDTKLDLTTFKQLTKVVTGDHCDGTEDTFMHQVNGKRKLEDPVVPKGKRVQKDQKKDLSTRRSTIDSMDQDVTLLIRMLYQFIDIGQLFKSKVTKHAKRLRSVLLKYSQGKPLTEVHDEKVLECLGKSMLDVKAMAQDTDMANKVARTLIRSSDVIFCTLAAAGARIFKPRSTKDKPWQIQDLIIDEAAAATEAETSVPFHLQPSRCLAVGDPKQLPATVMSPKAKQFGLDRSLHERLMFNCQYPYIMFREQYRMKPEIAAFPSQRFYNNRLQNSQQVLSRNYTGPYPLLEDTHCYPVKFHDIRGKEEQGYDGSYHNEEEADLCVQLIREYRQKHFGNDPDSRFRRIDTSMVRIITFYKAQTELINRRLLAAGMGRTGPFATTVDSCQGCESDLVIVSFVRTCKSRKKDRGFQNGNRTRSASDQLGTARSVAGFLTDDRRINVSLTRAKYELICIGNFGNMRRNDQVPTLQLLAITGKSFQVDPTLSPTRLKAKITPEKTARAVTEQSGTEEEPTRLFTVHNTARNAENNDKETETDTVRDVEIVEIDDDDKAEENGSTCDEGALGEEHSEKPSEKPHVVETRPAGMDSVYADCPYDTVVETSFPDENDATRIMCKVEPHGSPGARHPGRSAMDNSSRGAMAPCQMPAFDNSEGRLTGQLNSNGNSAATLQVREHMPRENPAYVHVRVKIEDGCVGLNRDEPQVGSPAQEKENMDAHQSAFMERPQIRVKVEQA